MSNGGIALRFDGAQPKIDAEAETGATVELRRNGRALSFDVVARSQREGEAGEIFGFAYAERTPEVFMAIADLMYSDQSVLQDRMTRRQVPVGLFVGTARFAFWSVSETLRCARYALGLVHDKPYVSHPDAPITIREKSLSTLMPDFADATPLLKEGPVYG